MSNSDIPPENDSEENEVESPVDGPTPDWMKMATSASSGPALTEEDTPDWLKDIKAGKGTGPLKEQPAAKEEDSDAGMSDLERLLAEEGIDLEAVAEERPEEAEGMSARDFMISTSDDELIRRQVGAEPMTEQPAAPPTQEIEKSSPAPAAKEEDSDAGMSDLERLLAEEGIDLEAVAEERPEGAEGMSARDFMISTSDDELIRSQVGAEPMAEQPATPVPPAPIDDLETLTDTVEAADDKMVIGEGLPDWLSEGDEEESAPIAEPQPVESEAVAPVVAEDVDDDKMVVEEDLPDWLQDTEEETSSAPEPIAAPGGETGDQMLAEDDRPDWLDEVDEEEAAPVTEPEPAISEPAMAMPDVHDDYDKMVVEDDLPDWLQDAEDEAPPAPEPIAVTADEADDEMLVEDDLPDWLGAVEDESIEEDEEDQDLPDWLSDIEEEEIDESIPQPSTTPTEALPIPGEGDIDVEDDELPDWLKEAQEDEAGVEPKSSPIMDQVVAKLDADDSAISDEDLPDWLQDVQDDEVSQPVLDTDTLSGDDTISEDELPDWLSDVQVDDSEPFEPSEPSPREPEEMVEEDLPDWLQEVKDEVLEPDLNLDDISVSAPEPVGDISTDVDGSGDDKELPDWLQDIEESPESVGVEEEVSPIPEVAPAEAAAERVTEEKIEEPTPVAQAAPAPAASGMPDWLKKLREGEDEEEEAAPQPKTPAPAPSPAPPQPVAEPEPSPPVTEVADAEKLPADAEERLKLAQAAREKGDIEEAVRYYNSLVSSGVFLDKIIEDMQQAVNAYPSNYLLLQVMGDAMMKDGRLQNALKAYRQALDKLPG